MILQHPIEKLTPINLTFIGQSLPSLRSRVQIPADVARGLERAEAMLSTVRSTMTDELDEEFKERIVSELVSTDLTPNSIPELLLSKPATGP